MAYGCRCFPRKSFKKAHYFCANCGFHLCDSCAYTSRKTGKKYCDVGCCKTDEQMCRSNGIAIIELPDAQPEEDLASAFPDVYALMDLQDSPL